MTSQLQARITTPRSSDSVPRLFQAAGSLEGHHPGEHLILVVEIDGLMWPKGEAEVSGPSWKCEVYEGGSPPNGRFTLSIFGVGDQGNNAIQAWRERGRVTDDYPGLESIRDGTRLHSISLRLVA